MARPMQLIRTGSPKEDIVAKLMRTAFVIGLAATWRPGAAAAQYSWSNLSVSVGLGTRSARLGIGASYTALDPLYDIYFEDPCWDYAYYEWYRHACHPGYDRIHVHHNYSVVSVNPYYRPRWRHYYWPYGYSSYTHFSLSFGVNYGYSYTPFYPAYGYPGYGYAAYGYPAFGQPTYGYPPYGYPAYGVVRYGGNRRASAVIRPAPAYRSSPLLHSSPLYKESPQAGPQRVAAAGSVASGRTTATRSITDRRARASSTLSSVRDRPAAQPQRRATSVAAPSRAQAPRVPSGVAGARSARARPSDVVLRGATVRTDGLSARRGNSTRLNPPSRATTRRPATSSDREPRNATQQNVPTSSEGRNRPSQAPTTDRSASKAPTDAGPRPTPQSRSGTAQSGAARSRPEAVTRSRALRERAPAPQAAPSARPRTSSRPQANAPSPSHGRAAQPSAAPRTSAPRARASSGRAPRGAASTRAAPTRSRSMQRPRR
jgi:hypothetical protein